VVVDPPDHCGKVSAGREQRGALDDMPAGWVGPRKPRDKGLDLVALRRDAHENSVTE
jgi:hypothetical protein